MNKETGSLNVNSENLLPIIKKWLYSDTDIFLRELVSNGCDAINKLKRLAGVGEAELPDDESFAVRVSIDKDAGTLTVSDNGIGMDFEEVKLYINQIAKSSAAEFVEKYQSDADKADIIGHFGLGFYSAFMAADKVEILSKSYKNGAAGVHWVSEGGSDFEMDECEREERGTDIILHLNDESKEFLEDYRVRAVLVKYMRFAPVEIYFGDDKAEDEEEHEEEHKHEHEHECDCEHHGEEGHECACEHEHEHEHSHEPKKPEPINDTTPLWQKNPSDITDEEYIAFYHKLFTDFNPPLFWIHLNMDYPNRLKGILYFPKLNHEIEYVEGQVKLYCNQVFIADNIKEVIPEFLLLLKGVVDCPDLPLNVSRSFLQNDGYTKKLSGYITRKVADKLTGLFKTEREKYEGYWDDVAPFVKYGCIKEHDFVERVEGALLFKTQNGKYLSREEYLAANGGKIGRQIYYATDTLTQSRYVSLFTEQGTDVAVLDTRLDTPFISFVESREYSRKEEERVKFVRVDTAIADALKSDEGVTDEEKEKNAKLAEMFKERLKDRNSGLEVTVETLKSADIPAVIVLTEDELRMREMSKYFGASMPGMNLDAGEKHITLNAANPLVKALANVREEDAGVICEHVYDLALIAHRQLTPEEMNAFILRGGKVLELAVK